MKARSGRMRQKRDKYYRGWNCKKKIKKREKERWRRVR